MRNFSFRSIWKYSGIALLLAANPTDSTVLKSPRIVVKPRVSSSVSTTLGSQSLMSLGGSLTELAPDNPMKLGVLPVTALINSHSNTIGGTTFSSKAGNFMQGSQLTMQQLGGTSGATINAGSATAGSNTSSINYLTGANLLTALGNRSNGGPAVLKPLQTTGVVNSTNNTLGALNVNLTDTVGSGTLGNSSISNGAIVQGGITYTGDATGSQNQVNIVGNPSSPNS